MTYPKHRMAPLYVPEARSSEFIDNSLPPIVRNLGGVTLSFQLTEQEQAELFRCMNLFCLAQDAAEALHQYLFPDGEPTEEAKTETEDGLMQTYGCLYEDMCDPDRSEFYILPYLVEQFLKADDPSKPQADTWNQTISDAMALWRKHRAEREADRAKPKESLLNPDPALIQVNENGDAEPVWLRFNSGLNTAAVQALDALINETYQESVKNDPDTPLTVIVLHAGSRFLNHPLALPLHLTQVELSFDGVPGWNITVDSDNAFEPDNASDTDADRSEADSKTPNETTADADQTDGETTEEKAETTGFDDDDDWEDADRDEEGPPDDDDFEPPDNIPDDV